MHLALGHDCGGLTRVRYTEHDLRCRVALGRNSKRRTCSAISLMRDQGQDPGNGSVASNMPLPIAVPTREVRDGLHVARLIDVISHAQCRTAAPCSAENIDNRRRTSLHPVINV